MIKKYTINKICVTSVSLFLILMFYLVPSTPESEVKIDKSIGDKKEVVVSIQMLNFYLEEALRKELINNKKFESYINHLLELDKMVRSWFYYEKIV